MQISFEVFDNYLKINLSGEYLFSEAQDILINMNKLAAENKRTRILLDARDLLLDPSVMEKFNMGELGVKIFGTKIKIALLRKPDHIDKFMENVAVNRGGNLYIVSNEQEALDWLLS